MLCLLVSIGFQVLFHFPPGVLFTFPSRYSSLSVTRSYLALGDGPPSFPPDSSCPVVLRIPLGPLCVSTTRLSLSLVQLSLCFVYALRCLSRGPYPSPYFYESVWALSLSLTTTQKIVRLLSFPPGTKMFQFPGFPSSALCVQAGITQYYSR